MFCYFNSIKVRLELYYPEEYQISEEFQFHKGAIRTSQDLCGIDDQRHFNSIKVRLELNAVILYRKLYPYFNSIKVRLELK